MVLEHAEGFVGGPTGRKAWGACLDQELQTAGTGPDKTCSASLGRILGGEKDLDVVQDSNVVEVPQGRAHPHEHARDFSYDKPDSTMAIEERFTRDGKLITR